MDYEDVNFIGLVEEAIAGNISITIHPHPKYSIGKSISIAGNLSSFNGKQINVNFVKNKDNTGNLIIKLDGKIHDIQLSDNIAPPFCSSMSLESIEGRIDDPEKLLFGSYVMYEHLVIDEINLGDKFYELIDQKSDNNAWAIATVRTKYFTYDELIDSGYTIPKYLQNFMSNYDKIRSVLRYATDNKLINDYDIIDVIDRLGEIEYDNLCAIFNLGIEHNILAMTIFFTRTIRGEQVEYFITQAAISLSSKCIVSRHDGTLPFDGFVYDEESKLYVAKLGYLDIREVIDKDIMYVFNGK